MIEDSTKIRTFPFCACTRKGLTYFFKRVERELLKNCLIDQMFNLSSQMSLL